MQVLRGCFCYLCLMLFMSASYSQDSEVDECAANICEHATSCSNTAESFHCECEFGFEGKTCSEVKDFCKLNLCSENSFCSSSFGSYTCFCFTGYYGVHCTEEYDWCSNDHPCVHGSCSIGGGYYTCNCTDGYEGTTCNEEVNECQPNPCENGGTCNDLIGMFNCTCAEGWTGDTCLTPIDECQSNPCTNKGNCTDLVAGYNCTCKPGFTGKNCENDINECEDSPCQNNGSCINVKGTFRCDCSGTGFRGDLCELETDDCAGQPCFNGASCHDRFKGYECECHTGYTGGNCEIDTKECMSSPCHNQGICYEKSNQTLYPDFFQRNFSHANAQGFHCDCMPGYEGTFCETDINECDKLKPCHNSGNCTNLNGTYSCACTRKYAGRNCSALLIGCDGNHGCGNNSTCIPYLQNEEKGIHNYTCDCTPGFTGFHCTSSTTMTIDCSSQAVFQPATSYSLQTVSFDFRTILFGGLITSLTFHQKNDSLKIFLKSGRVYVNCSDMNSTLLVSDDKALNDSMWHSVNFTATKTIPTSLASAKLHKITVGTNNCTTGYAGCLRDFKVNDVVYAFENANHSNVQEGCIRRDVCSQITCNGTGRCVDLWTKYECHCKRPGGGKNCSGQIRPATFNYLCDRSYAQFNLSPILSKTHFNVSVFFRTRDPNGPLCSTETPNSNTEASNITSNDLRIILAEGKLQVQIGSNFIEAGEDLNDGKRHFIKITITEGRLNLSIDHGKFLKDKTLSPPIKLSTIPSLIYVGGFPDTNPTTDASKRREITAQDAKIFKGVLQDIEINGFLLTFYPDDVPSGTAILTRNTLQAIQVVKILRGVVSDPLCGSDAESRITNPCLNNASCQLVHFNFYECSCTDEWRGRNCEIPVFCKQISCPNQFTCIDLLNGGFDCVGPVTLSISSQPLAYSYRGLDLTFGDIKFAIRTRSTNASLLSIQSMLEFIHFDLDFNGSFSFTFLSSTGNTTFVYNATLSDGIWHNISVVFYDRVLTLEVDNVTTNFTTPLLGTFLHDLLLQANNIVRIGSSVDSFIGCINEVRIGNQLLPFYNQTLLTNHTSAIQSTNFTMKPPSTLPLLGCHSDVCNKTFNWCENNGTCIDLFNLFNCQCQPGYMGLRCEHYDLCQQHRPKESYCANNGTCRFDQASEHLFFCKCPHEYTGQHCEHYNPCFNFTCHNNGLCEIQTSENVETQSRGLRNLVVGGTSSAKCKCPEGFYGTNCEITTEQPGINIWVIIGPVIGAALLVVLVIVLVTMCSAPTTKGSYSIGSHSKVEPSPVPLHKIASSELQV